MPSPERHVMSLQASAQSVLRRTKCVATGCIMRPAGACTSDFLFGLAVRRPDLNILQRTHQNYLDSNDRGRWWEWKVSSSWSVYYINN